MTAIGALIECNFVDLLNTIDHEIELDESESTLDFKGVVHFDVIIRKPRI